MLARAQGSVRVRRMKFGDLVDLPAMREVVECGANEHAPPIEVAHASLKRWGGDYKSCCPVCKEGVLFVWRQPVTHQLSRHDRCVRCAQRFIYTDERIGNEALEVLS